MAAFGVLFSKGYILKGGEGVRLFALKSVKLKLILFSIMHLVTDGLCAFIVFSRLYPDNPEQSFYVFVGYNLLAFVTQSPVGMLIDKYNKPKIFLAVSIALMLLGYLFSELWLLSVTCIGISNSLFHVAGGRYITDKSGNDISHLGIFVSTGAIGLVLGQSYFSFAAMPYIFFVLLIVCGLPVIFSEDTETVGYDEVYTDEKTGSLALLAVIGVVLIRAFVGKLITPDFELTEHMPLLFSLLIASGKAVGGIMSKFIGITKTTCISTAVAAVCLTLGAGNTILFMLGLFAFNFSMPITLYLANILLKGKEGFAFGSLAAILAPGYFLAMSFSYSLPMRIFTALLCLASMFLIIIISRKVSAYDRTVASNNNP